MSISEAHNYYETLVAECIDALELNKTKDSDYLTDLYCLALNQLPAYYIRFGVDMAYFTDSEKRQEMEDRVSSAVNLAIKWLEKSGKPRTLD